MKIVNTVLPYGYEDTENIIELLVFNIDYSYEKEHSIHEVNFVTNDNSVYGDVLKGKWKIKYKNK